MKFAAIFAFAALQISAASALAINARAGAPGDGPIQCAQLKESEGTMTYNGLHSDACTLLLDNCQEQINATQTTLVWSVRTCVAAATCIGTARTFTLAGCANPNIYNDDDDTTDHLDYNIYALIVGDCAWQEGGCPITQQNYIDFIYGTLSAIGSSVWPTSADQVVTTWWDPIKTWAATGDTVPYHNFDDWLHYSNSQ